MPCRSDHMEANAAERYTKDTAYLIVYATVELGVADSIAPWITKAAGNYYGAPQRSDELTRILCALCQTMSEDQKTKIIYNGRSGDARRLAEWWDEHQKVDARREAAEAQAAEKAQRVATARAALIAAGVDTDGLKIEIA